MQSSHVLLSLSFAVVPYESTFQFITLSTWHVSEPLGSYGHGTVFFPSHFPGVLCQILWEAQFVCVHQISGGGLAVWLFFLLAVDWWSTRVGPKSWSWGAIKDILGKPAHLISSLLKTFDVQPIIKAIITWIWEHFSPWNASAEFHVLSFLIHAQRGPLWLVVFLAESGFMESIPRIESLTYQIILSGDLILSIGKSLSHSSCYTIKFWEAMFLSAPCWALLEVLGFIHMVLMSFHYTLMEHPITAYPNIPCPAHLVIMSDMSPEGNKRHPGVNKQVYSFGHHFCTIHLCFIWVMSLFNFKIPTLF